MDSDWGHYLDISDMRVDVTNDVDNRQIKSFMNKYVHKIKEQPQPQPQKQVYLTNHIDEESYLDQIDIYNYIPNIDHLRFNILKYICFTFSWLFIKN